MTNRDLFHATMRGENGGQLLHFEQGFNVPYKKWYTQGMPTHVEPGDNGKLSEWENLYDHFNVTSFNGANPNINFFCYPQYESKLLFDDGQRITYKDGNGNTFTELSNSVKMASDDGANIGSPPYEVDFAIKCRKDYENARDLYIGNLKERYSAQWIDENADIYNAQTDYINSFFVHGPYAYLRVLLGTEMAMVAPYEDPDWVRLMLRDHLDTAIGTTEELLRRVNPDMSFVWEDCCGSTGPFMSPPIFDDVFAWWYRQWKDYTKSMGVKWTVLDTDGNPSPLVTRWYANGIDCMLPWEVNGVDMLKFADEFPQYKMFGGIYKHMFEPDAPSQVGRFDTANVYEAIDQELERVVGPMRKRGGYFPALDHGAHYYVDYMPYKYYSEKLIEYGKANVVNRVFKS